MINSFSLIFGFIHIHVLPSPLGEHHMILIFTYKLRKVGKVHCADSAERWLPHPWSQYWRCALFKTACKIELNFLQYCNFRHILQRILQSNLKVVLFLTNTLVRPLRLKVFSLIAAKVQRKTLKDLQKGVLKMLRSIFIDKYLLSIKQVFIILS